jgi:hypothetical protein
MPSYGNTTSLGTQGRTGVAILIASSSRAYCGSFSRIYHCSPQLQRAAILQNALQGYSYTRSSVQFNL